jgi:hypothetical protein
VADLPVPPNWSLRQSEVIAFLNDQHRPRPPDNPLNFLPCVPQIHPRSTDKQPITACGYHNWLSASERLDRPGAGAMVNMPYGQLSPSACHRKFVEGKIKMVWSGERKGHASDEQGLPMHPNARWNAFQLRTPSYSPAWEVDNLKLE